MFKFSSVPAYSFGKSAAKATSQHGVPGPGAYDTNTVSQMVYRSERTTALIKLPVGRAPAKTIDIGPGQYEVDGLQKRIKGYYFTSSRKCSTGPAPANPGPGTYDYEQNMVTLKSKGAQIAFNKSARLDSVEGQRGHLPGPGQYQVEQLSPSLERFRCKSGYKFSKSMKTDNLTKQPVPGPGAYQSDQINALGQSIRGFSLSKSTNRPESTLAFVPGPGSYEPTARPSSGIKFGRDARKDLARKDEVPGPGIYSSDSKDIVAFKKAPAFKFGKEEKAQQPKDVPGPGAYEMNPLGLESRGIRFGKDKKDRTKENEVPGPGNYTYPNFFQNNNKGTFKFNKEPRTNQGRIDSPGPGAYNPLKQVPSPKMTIPHAPRIKESKNEVPGPGQYDARLNNWDQHFPKFVKPERRAQPPIESVGPGIYNIPHSIPDVARYNYPDSAMRKIKL